MHGQQDKHIFGRPRKKASRGARSKNVVAFLWTFLFQFQKQNDHHLGLVESPRAKLKLLIAAHPPQNPPPTTPTMTVMRSEKANQKILQTTQGQNK